MNQEKHIGLYGSSADFEADKINLKSPYIACIATENKGYEVRYSSDPVINDIDSSNIVKEFEKIKGEKVYLTVAEYEALSADKEGASAHQATDVYGNVTQIKYDPSKLYFTYEPEEKEPVKK